MAKFETMDPKIVTEAIHASFNLNEYQTIPFEKERSGEIIREAMEGLGMKNLIPQSNIVLKELFEADLTSAEAVAYFLYSLTQRKRQNRSLMQLQMAHFPSNCTIESYDFSRVNEKIGRQIRELEKSEWIARHNNVYLYGNPGMGKTHLAIALGRRAICKGYSTCFVSAGTFFRKMQDAHRKGLLEKTLKPYLQQKLLILDDLAVMKDVDDSFFGFVMLRLMTERQHKTSTIITSNLSLADLGKTFPGAALLSSAIDRFIEDAISLPFFGDSYRRLKWKQRQATIIGTEGDASKARDTASPKRLSSVDSAPAPEQPPTVGSAPTNPKP